MDAMEEKELYELNLFLLLSLYTLLQCYQQRLKQLISHDLSTVSAFADSIAVMYKGIIAETGSVHKVLSPPSHPYTDLLISSVPELRVGWLEDADKNIQSAKTLLEKQDII